MMQKKDSTNDGTGNLIAVIPVFNEDIKKVQWEVNGKSLLSIAIECSLSPPSVSRIIVMSNDQSLSISKELRHRVGMLTTESGLTTEWRKSDEKVFLLNKLNEDINHGSEGLNNYDGILMIDPLCPLKERSDIHKAMERYLRQESGQGARLSVVTVSVLPNHFHPKKIVRLSGNGHLEYYDKTGKNVYRRQQLEGDDYYIQNNAISIIDPMNVEERRLKNERIIPLVIEDPVIQVSDTCDMDLVKALFHK